MIYISELSNCSNYNINAININTGCQTSYSVEYQTCSTCVLNYAKSPSYYFYSECSCNTLMGYNLREFIHNNRQGILNNLRYEDSVFVLKKTQQNPDNILILRNAKLLTNYA